MRRQLITSFLVAPSKNKLRSRSDDREVALLQVFRKICGDILQSLTNISKQIALMMDPKVNSTNRIYSTARVRRRENLIKQRAENEAHVSLPKISDNSVDVKESSDSGSKSRSGRRRAVQLKFHPNSENIKPKTRSQDYSNIKFDDPSSQSERQRIKRLAHLERGLSAEDENLDVLSDSTADSDSSLRLTHQNLKNHTDTVKVGDKFIILCSLLPDEILRDPVSLTPRTCQTALIFPDVSGFTQLCQKYDKTGQGGPSRLTTVLNGYIGSMIRIVLSRNGDVCKFGGDAFLCLWQVTEDQSMTEIVHLAIESAIDIQKNCGEHKTDVGVKLRVKVAVAAGNAVFSVIGNNTRKYYVIVGPPVLEVREAEQLCRPGDIIVTPSAWKHVRNYMVYSFTYHSDNKHIKVHDFGPLWKSPQTDFKNTMEIRPFLKTLCSLNIPDLRPFILPPVMKSIDLNRPLDYLTEMRQVAIVFFNVTLNFSELLPEEIVSLSNQAFHIVARKVDKAGGGTNKLTLFDKDMALLAVFGLKGFKHELASQVALKCAYSCLESLKKLKINTASAGVTTGMVYCGVIGHPLRREYTVMGHPVNMAARMMCAYQGIVSCDRSTFLSSKLESGHFEVLEVEYLKGIQNAGPFYKFNAYLKRTKLKLDHKAQPLLGRAKEVAEFEAFLRRGAARDSTVNFFIIFGSARMGKSRLVAKLIKVAENETVSESQSKVHIRQREIHVLPLTEDDCKVSYSTIRLIFQPLLGLSDSPSVAEREDKILTKLGEHKEIPLLAAFNQIFNVNFDLTPQYLALDHKQQVETQMTWLKNLYNCCFPKDEKWLIVVDDAEFMDGESWRFLTWCSLESQNALYLLTIGQKKALSEVALDCLDRMKAKRIILTEIEKWFYLGLACQILGVRAIPVELENLLQSYKSSGNPGWLESFLLSMLQAKSIYIGQASSQKMKNLGLVAPPEFMITTRVTENRQGEDSHWVDCLETFESMTCLKQDTFRVCLLGPDFHTANEKDGELTMDVMFIKRIDGLKPLEQLVLKAGSVLGNNIKRAALKYVISKETIAEDKQLAKATKTLFEMKILRCGKGDLTKRNQLITRRILDTSSENEIVCECVGIKIPDSCKDLPKYANCGYMQFRFPTFRETLYNLLLDDQKKSFHNSCVEFLRENTYKCKSCKNVRFTNVFGYKEDDKVILACTFTPMHGVRSTTFHPEKAVHNSLLRERSRTISPKPSESQIENDVRGSDNDVGTLGVTDVTVGDCQCSQILSSVYSVLLEHAKGSGRKDLMLEIQLEFAAVNLTMYNIPLTMQILEDALVLVNQMKESKEYPEFCTPYIYSKIYTLMGATKLSMGRLDESLDLLKMGLKFMNAKFPTTKNGAKLLIAKHSAMLWMTIKYFPSKAVGSASDKKAPYTDLLSECLGLISIVYMYMQNELLAKSASLWSLNKALESNRNLYVLCSAYTNLIEVSYYGNDLKSCAELEGFAIDVCKRCSVREIEKYEWEAIGRLYKVIFRARHVRAEIEEAVHIGFQSIKIASVIHSTNLKLDLIPDLIFALVQMNRLSEAVTLLQELEFISRLDSDKSSRLWYYAMCLDFQLYTGFTIVPYEVCENFVKGEDLVLVRNPFAKHRLFTSMWLWCVRNTEWDLIKSYGNILKNSEMNDIKETPCTIFTRLEKLEGLLITLVHKMEVRNIQGINAMLGEIRVLMNKLKKDIKIAKVFQPRYELLKTYYRQIRFRDDSYYRFLDQAQTQAEKMKDQNTSQWIMHLKLLWSNAITPIDRDQWNEHCRKNFIEWHESDGVSKKPVMYSLPLPKF